MEYSKKYETDEVCDLAPEFILDAVRRSKRSSKRHIWHLPTQAHMHLLLLLVMLLEAPREAVRDAYGFA